MMFSKSPSAFQSWNKHTGLEKAVKAAVSLFIVVYFACAFFWAVPKQNALANFVSNKVSVLWKFWGLDSDWGFFAPDLRTCNYDMVAVISFQNGTSALWPMPRFQTMSQYQRFARDKFSKWAIDWMPYEDYREFWPDFARYLGRIHYATGNEPYAVTIYLITSDIPTPEWLHKGAQSGRASSEADARHYKTLFYYNFKPQDFEPQEFTAH